MWDLNNADEDDQYMNIPNIPNIPNIEDEEEDLEYVNYNSKIPLLDDDNGVVSNNTSSFTTYNFDIMSTATTSSNNICINDVALSSSSRSKAATDWLNLSSSSFPADSAALLSYNQQQQQPPTAAVNKKSRRGPRSRSSQYRGVTFYRRTGRWESHIWDCGKQVYLGGFDTAHAAARAYDRAAIKFRGTDADINFNIADYQEDIGQMKNLSKEEFVHVLRRLNSGLARGTSKYGGVTLQNCRRWEARMGQLLEQKTYDVDALRCNASEAATNFESANGHDLDLSLSIHSSSDYNPQWNDGSINKAWKDPKVLVYSTSAAGKGQIPVPYSQQSTSSNHPITMSQGLAKHSGSYFPMSYEVHSSVAPSSSRMPNRGWQHPLCHGSTTSTEPSPFSSAASSGFSLPSYVTATTSITQQARQSYPDQNYYNRP